MRLGTVLLSVAAFACATGFARAADPPLRVLRHLSFAVTVDEESKTDTKVAGFDGASSGTASNDNGSTTNRGTILVDVVGATADGGLVVDVSEDAAARRAPVVRVGVTAKQLFFDPSRVVTQEERLLLHYLARDFVASTELAPGTSWAEDMSTPGTAGKTTYQVTAVDVAAKTLALAVVGASSGRGPNGYDTRTRGTLTYDTGVLVPIDVEMKTTTTIQNVGRLTTVDTTVNAKLLDDSFRKPPAT